MSRNRLISLGIVGAIVVVALLGWMLGVSPVLDQTSAAKAQQAAIATSNDATAARLVVMKKQFANLSGLQSELAELSVSVPAGSAIPSFLQEINGLTVSTAVHLESLTVNNALAYVDPNATAAAAATGTAAAGATASPSPSPSATDAAAAATPTAPVASGPTARLVAIPVKVIVTGSYDQTVAFGGALQTGGRLFFVTTFSNVQDPSTGLFTATLEGSVYALPTVGANATPAPTPTQTPAPSTTPTPSSTVSAKPSGTPSSTPMPTGTAKP